MEEQRRSFLKNIFLFLVALGLCYFVQAFFSCSEQGHFIVVYRLLVVVTSLAMEHKF